MSSVPPSLTSSVSGPIVLCILDGWGCGEKTSDNAIANAQTPHWNRLLDKSPHTLLEASAGHVGLPEGQMGNSEVGHMNIGAGRIILQDLPRINNVVNEGALRDLPTFQGFIHRLQMSKGTCHLLGLLSPGGIHSHQQHLFALGDALTSQGVPVVFHPFLDGRDTPPQSARAYIQALTQFCESHALASIGTVGGRYFAMDRDNRWERVQKAYNAMVFPSHETAPSSGFVALENSYAKNVYDEFVGPVALQSYQGMKDGDGILMANFRGDRAREILAALLDPDFQGFQRQKTVAFAAALGMTEYSEALAQHMDTLFPNETPAMTLGEVLAQHNLKQLRVAETEKYAHVTFFFNGGREEPFPGEERVLIPSPKVDTYDQKPEMSAHEVTDAVVQGIASGDFPFIVVNYANPDMVGHTGNYPATVKAIETVDACLGRIVDALTPLGGRIIVTADHGNAEMMEDPHLHSPHTAHTTNRVPFVVSPLPSGSTLATSGCLADIAPTILALMNISQPPQMTGQSLLETRS